MKNRHYKKLVIGLTTAIVVLAFSVSIASAQITIDGDDSDWASISVAVNDPNETDPDPEKNIPDYWDMDEVYYHYEPYNQDMYWMMKTYESIVPNLGWWDEETIYLFIDADRNGGTGCQYGDRSYGLIGADYRMSWSPGDSTATFKSWDPNQGPVGSWKTANGYTYDYAAAPHDDGGGGYDYDIFEIRIPRLAIEDVWQNGDGWIAWSWAYDNIANNPDDMTPDDGFHENHAPEPATLALLVMGLGALYTRRRKSSK